MKESFTCGVGVFTIAVGVSDVNTGVSLIDTVPFISTLRVGPTITWFSFTGSEVATDESSIDFPWKDGETIVLLSFCNVVLSIELSNRVKLGETFRTDEFTQSYKSKL